MTDHELRSVVQDLIGVLQDQAKQIESLVAHIERVTARPEQRQFSVVVSELSELQHRVKALLPEKTIRER